MAKLPRKNQKVLGSNSSQNGQFGSRRAGLGNLTNDIEEIQALPAWPNGWPAATVSGQKLPCLEEMQGVQYVETYQLAYIFQEGIPEYNTATHYFIGSIAKKTGTTELYKSIVDDNVGNALTDNTKWLFLGDLAATFSVGAKVNRTTTQVIASPTPTLIAWDSEVYDDAAWHDNVTDNSRITVDFTGRVQVILNVKGATSAAALTSIHVLKNGTVAANQCFYSPSAVGDLGGSICIEFDCVPTDYFTCSLTHGAGNFTIDADSSFSVRRIK